MFWVYLCTGNMFTILGFILGSNGFTDAANISGITALFFIVLSFFHIAGD